MTGQQEWTEHITHEIDVLAHDAKLGTRHELHDGWYFELHHPTQSVHDGTAPRRVLTCGCGVVLASAPVPVRDTRIVWYPAPDQPDGADTGPVVVGVYTYDEAQRQIEDLRADQERRGQYRIEPT